MAAKGNEILLELKAENKLLVAKLKESEDKLNRLENSAKKSGGGISSALSMVKKAVVAYLGVSTIAHLVGLAAEIDSVETSFYDLAAGAEAGAGGLLEAMGKAAQGTVDDTAMMKAANSAMLTLGEEVADQLPKLMEISVASAKATGKTTEETFNKMVTAVQSGSSRMLRQVGLSASQVDVAVKKYAASLGLTVSQLTEAEKKQAYLNAVMTVGEGVIKRTAGQQLTFSQKLQVIKKSIGDMADTTAKTLLPAFDNLADAFIEIFNNSAGLSEIFNKVIKGISRFINLFAYSLQQINIWAETWSDSHKISQNATEHSIARVKELRQEIISMTNSSEQYRGTGMRMAADIKMATKNFTDMNGALKKGFTAEQISLVQSYNGALSSALKSAQQSSQESMTLAQKMEQARLKYDETEKKIDESDKKRKEVRKREKEKELIDEDAILKRKQQQQQDDIKYFEYIGQLEQAQLLSEQLAYQQVLDLHGTVAAQRTKMDEAYNKKRVVGEQQANNKMKQSDLDYLRAKLKFDSMEYQSAKEVFGQSSTLMQSKNKFFFNLGKSLAIAVAMMNAAEGVTRVWGAWGAYPPVAAAFSAIVLAATGIEIAKIKSTKLPSYQKGKLPVFADGYNPYPSDHFPAMIGAKEAVVTAESAKANQGLINAMFANPGKAVSGQNVTVMQTNNFSGNVMSKEFVDNHVIPHLETQARYQGKQLYAEKK
jgi:hypothetical protein